MGCFDECLSGMMEPYGGNMPLFNSPETTDATVTIVQESYDDGMSVTRIQTPPRTPTCKLVDAINNILGMMGEMSVCFDKPCDDVEKECPTTDEDGQKSDKPLDKKDSEDGKKNDIQSEPNNEDKENSDSWKQFKKPRGSR